MLAAVTNLKQNLRLPKAAAQRSGAEKEAQDPSAGLY